MIIQDLVRFFERNISFLYKKISGLYNLLYRPGKEAFVNELVFDNAHLFAHDLEPKPWAKYAGYWAVKLPVWAVLKHLPWSMVEVYLAAPTFFKIIYASNFFFNLMSLINFTWSSLLSFENYTIKKDLLAFYSIKNTDITFWYILFDNDIIDIISSYEGIILIFIWKIITGILIIVPILLIIAYSTLLEWKVLASVQKWWGPNKVGIKGSAQPLIDGVKLIIKEIVIPVQSENWIFILASQWSIVFMILLWFVVPTSPYGSVLQFDYEILVLFCISVLGSISILLAGWSSNSKYAFLGGVWAGAQMISYELVLGIIVLIVMLVTSSTQIIDVVNFQINYGSLFWYLPLETALFLILIVAETNRAPFDFAEAESELVSGYNTEYSGLPFAFFFIAEYGNILYMSLLTVLFFFGGWSVNFLPDFLQSNFLFTSLFLFFKTYLIYFFFLWLWSALPRFRYDQLMSLCWKVFLPLTLVCLVLWITVYMTIDTHEFETLTFSFYWEYSNYIIELIKKIIA